MYYYTLLLSPLMPLPLQIPTVALMKAYGIYFIMMSEKSAVTIFQGLVI